MHRNHFQNHKILKSNMDRFIGLTSTSDSGNITFLKSNMDRFIVFPRTVNRSKLISFKIQYG